VTIAARAECFCSVADRDPCACLENKSPDGWPISSLANYRNGSVKRHPTRVQRFPKAVTAATAGHKSSDAPAAPPPKFAVEGMVQRIPDAPTVDPRDQQTPQRSVQIEVHSRRAETRGRSSRREKPQKSSRGAGLKTCQIHTRIRRSPMRDGGSSSLVRGLIDLAHPLADIRQVSDIYPTNKRAAFARNPLIFF